MYLHANRPKTGCPILPSPGLQPSYRKESRSYWQVHAVRDAEGAERQHYAAEKQKDDKRFADQLAESQSHLRAVDVATEKLGQSALV